jgi:hypothetical protein
MEVFIHEDYVNKRREQRRRQLQMLQVESNRDASRQAALATRDRESPRAPAQCLTPTAASPSGVRSPAATAAAAGETAVWPSEHRRLFDCFKPY